MLQARPQGALGAPNTRPGSLLSSLPQEHQEPSITERINYILLASTCTNSLEVTELRCLVIDAVVVLCNTKQSIVTLASRSLSTKPTTIKSLLSQVWDDIQ